MKVKELDRSTLTLEQKIGQLYCANVSANNQENIDYVIEMIREHRLGSIWIQPGVGHREETIGRILEAADYPILIMCDAEEGHVDYRIPQALSLTTAGKPEYAFSFGRLTAATHRNMGYNIVCNPVLDVKWCNCSCGGVTRSMGPDKEKIALYGGAVARGMHEGGVLAVGKHYPGGCKGKPYDTHMREGYDEGTAEEFAATALYPYRRLMEEGLLDGIMVGHQKLINVDPDRPAALSKPVISMIRELGFDGFVTTDALNMMGIVLKYGYTDPIGMAVAAGADLPLPWGTSTKPSYEAMLDCYQRGILTDADVEAALDRVLAAQHKVALLPPIGECELYEEDKKNIRRLHMECIAARCEEGLSPSISRDGRHLFTIITDESLAEPDVD